MNDTPTPDTAAIRARWNDWYGDTREADWPGRDFPETAEHYIARQDVPYLLDTIDALTAENQQQARVIERVRDWHGESDRMDYGDLGRILSDAPVSDAVVPELSVEELADWLERELWVETHSDLCGCRDIDTCDYAQQLRSSSASPEWYVLALQRRGALSARPAPSVEVTDEMAEAAEEERYRHRYKLVPDSEPIEAVCSCGWVGPYAIKWRMHCEIAALTAALSPRRGHRRERGEAMSDMTAMSHETHGLCFCPVVHCDGDDACEGECRTDGGA